MAKKQSTTTQPLTGELVTVQGTKGSAVPQTTQAWAEAFYKFEVGVQRTRIEQWSEFIAKSYNAPGDFSDLAQRVKLLAIGELVKRYQTGKNGSPLKLDSGLKQWPDAMAAEYASRWEGIISTMNRVERAIQSTGKDHILSLFQKNLGYHATIQQLGSSGRGRAKKGAQTAPKVPEPVKAPVADAQQPDGAKVADGADATVHTPESLAAAAKLQGFFGLTKAIENLEESFIPGLLSAVAARLKHTNVEAYIGLAADLLDVIQDSKDAAPEAPKEKKAS